jgi:hypothetical protein
LDWTENPLAALFNAVVDKYDKDGEVVSLLPDWRMTFGQNHTPQSAKLPHPPVRQRHHLVKETIQYLFDEGKRPEDQLIVPLHPDLQAGRMLQQGASFTLHMPGSSEINENAGNVRRFTIDRKKKPALLDELRAIGVNWATLFPDLDHLTREIRAN